MNFTSDNVYGTHPAILEAMRAANDGTAPSYCYDDLTAKAEARLAEIFGCDLQVFLVTTGTAANGLALSALVPPFGAILCHADSHIAVEECNGPEFFTGGAKIMGLSGGAGKITPSAIDHVLKGFIRAEHDPKPAAVSISNVTESGTVYRPHEIRAIADLAHSHAMSLHMDGARFANALASTRRSPAELSWKSGVDVLSFGATKNGAMMLEAVIFFEPSLAKDFRYRRMRAGQLVSKSRYLAAQMLAYLHNDLWLANARQANRLAAELADGLMTLQAVRLPFQVEANEVFAVMPRTLYDRLRASGVHFYEWTGETVPGGLAIDEIFVRFVLSWATPPQTVTQFLQTAQKLQQK